MKNYHAEKTVFIDRTTARKVMKAMHRAGFIEDTSKIGAGRTKVNNFRIVIYHPDLMKKVDKICGKGIQWIEKSVI